MYLISAEVVDLAQKFSFSQSKMILRFLVYRTGTANMSRVSHHILPDSLGIWTIQAMTMVFGSLELKYLIFQNVSPTSEPTHNSTFRGMHRNHN